MTPEQRRRWKTACAEDGRTYAEWVLAQLDANDAKRKRQRAAQMHPLHQPARKSIYPGGGV